PTAAPTPAPTAIPTPVPAATWTFCANEGAVCSFTGTKQIRYGLGTSFKVGTYTGSVSCSNTVFGDPLPGSDKKCEYAGTGTSPTPTPTPTPAPAPIAAPTPVPAPAPSGNSIAAADCSFASVQTAVNSAKSGTTVLIPAGDCNWGTSSLNVPGGIYLKGSGKTATTIRRGGSVPTTSSLVRFQCAAGSAPVALSDMQLVGWGTLGTDDMGVRLENSCVRDFRIFNSKFSKFTFAAIDINGEGGSQLPKGVIYNNEIVNNYTVGRNNLGYGVVVYANNQGGDVGAVLGSAETVFVEDNVFSGNRHSIAANSGARYVLRYNSLTQTNETKNWGQVDAHGSGNPCCGTVNSTFAWEVYNNKFLSAITDGGTGWAMFMRGGDGVVFNNTFASGLVQGVGITVETGCTGSYPAAGQTRSAHVWGNSHNVMRIYSSGGDCNVFFQQNRDYFLAARPGYTPYAYPHPARSI
ncbi:MAG: hypothetical protein WCC58_08105, partial [Burkholderiales bacterium]